MYWKKYNGTTRDPLDTEKLDETEQLLPGLKSYPKDETNDPTADIERLASLARDSG